MAISALQTITNRQSIGRRPLTRAAELNIRSNLGLTPQALRLRALRALVSQLYLVLLKGRAKSLRRNASAFGSHRNV